MIWELFGRVCLFAGCLILAIILHELGHYLAFKNFKKNVRVRFNRVGNSLLNRRWEILLDDYRQNKTLKDKEYHTILWFGIAFGFLPIIIMVSVGIFTWIEYLAFILVYLFGCREDVTNLLRSN